MMATVNPLRSDDWKDKYFKTLNELDRLEQTRDEVLTRASRDLLVLLDTWRGTSADFDRELASVRACASLAKDDCQTRLRALVKLAPTLDAKAATAGTSVTPPSLSEFLAALAPPARFAEQVAGWRAAQEVEPNLGTLKRIAQELDALFEASGSERTLAARDALQVLIDHLALPEHATARLSALTPKLQQATEVATVKALAKELADFVADYATSLHLELVGLHGFLQVIGHRLGNVAAHLRAEHSARGAAGSARSALDRAVRGSLATLRDNVRAGAPDVDIKGEIERQIASIDHHFALFMGGETARDQAASAREAELAEHVRALESETAGLREKLAAAQDRATRDALTGLPNRFALSERCAQEQARCARSGHRLAVIVLDLDHFKTINDTWGHQAGDRVLKHVARELASRIRTQDFIARYGGEEFVLLLPDTDLAGALRTGENLRQHLAGCHFKYRDAPVAVTISCGIAEAARGETVDAAMARADQALYAAKERGRNRCEAAASA
jgi:diguanylate cyclase